MVPPCGTPVSNELLPTIRQPGARALLQLLRIELHAHKIVGDIVHGDGRPRLNLGVLDVWSDDPTGTFLCWGPSFLEEPADHCAIGENNLPGVAIRIAELHTNLTAASTSTAPGSGQLNAAVHWSAARDALERLRTALRPHQIFAAVASTGGMPHLMLSPEVTAWADRAVTTIRWSGGYDQEPRGHVPIKDLDDLPEVAQQLATLVGKSRAEQVTVP